MSNWKKRFFIKKEKELKEKCSACNGSGYYDTTNSPKCSSCQGKGYIK